MNLEFVAYSTHTGVAHTPLPRWARRTSGAFSRPSQVSPHSVAPRPLFHPASSPCTWSSVRPCVTSESVIIEDGPGQVLWRCLALASHLPQSGSCTLSVVVEDSIEHASCLPRLRGVGLQVPC